MLKILAERSPWDGRIKLLVVDEWNGAPKAVGLNVVMQVKAEGEVCDPTLTLEGSAGQSLMDELWRCGLRPTEGTGSAGALAATEKHLNDMRRVAFGLAKQHGVE